MKQTRTTRLSEKELDLIPRLDVPFEYKNQCWFCGEPVFKDMVFISNSQFPVELPRLKVPSCEECFGLCRGEQVPYIELLRDLVKDKLTKRHQKALAIGTNWTQEELEECDFSGAALEGFKRSAWQMFLITKERVNFQGWPICVDGITVGSGISSDQVTFDDITYPNLLIAIRSISQSYQLDRGYLAQVIEIVGQDRLGYAISFCRATQGDAAKRKDEHLLSLQDLLVEEKQAEAERLVDADDIHYRVREIPLEDVQELILYRTLIPAVAIQWALNRDITLLEQIVEAEDDVFSAFSEQGELVAFSYFNGLQIYFEKRETDLEWATNEDPNRHLF